MTAPTTPRVSVILRTKNRPLLLRRALQSILGQSLTDFALVVVDDDPAGGSARTTLEESGAASDPRVSLLQPAAPLGRSGAINAGLDAVDSEFWVLHDDDDSWHPDFLTTTVAHLDATPADGAVATRCEVVFEHLEDDAYVEDRREILAADVSRVSLAGMAARNSFPPISLLVRRSAQEAVGSFDPDLPVQEDWEFILRLLSRYPIGFIDGEPLAFWHHRPAASGDEANSVIAEVASHAEHEAIVRDAFLRRDLAGSGTGLGHTLAVIGVLERSMAQSQEAQSALNDHVALSHQTLKLELGRLRGEVLALRDAVEKLKGTSDQIAKKADRTHEFLQRVLGPTGRVRQQVQDLWASSARAAKVARNDGRNHPRL